MQYHEVEPLNDGRVSGHFPFDGGAHIGGWWAYVAPHEEQVSNNLRFEETIAKIVGLYLDPRDRVVVLCVNERSQIQALDRAQPGLPLRKKRAARKNQAVK